MSSTFISRKISIPSMVLNLHGLVELKNILDKTGNIPSFQFETDKENISFNDPQFFKDTKWPKKIKQLRFNTGYSGSFRIDGYIDNPDLLGFSHITIEASDRDWISARVDELQRFIDDHRNLHFVFHKLKYIIPQGLLLGGLLVYWFNSLIIEKVPEKSNFIIYLLTFYSVAALYWFVFPRVFPYLILEPEKASISNISRKVFKYIIPGIFIGLVAQLIWSLVT